MSERNRMSNAENRFQGTRRRVLCVCSAGLLRSPTASVVLASTYGYNTRAAGIAKEYALVHADSTLLHWADEIVCMEEWQKSIIQQAFSDNGVIKKADRIVCLNIKDEYSYMDSSLQELILERYKAEPDEEKE